MDDFLMEPQLAGPPNTFSEIILLTSVAINEKLNLADFFQQIQSPSVSLESSASSSA
jgi:hypothetical protein